MRAATWGRPYGVSQSYSMLRAGEGTRPYGDPTGNVCSAKPGAESNRTSGNFRIPTAQWPGGNRGKPLKFCAPEWLPTQRGSHRNGGQGKACGRVRAPAPTAYPAPGTFARQSQARKRNRTSGNFCKPRAQWPGGNCGKPLKFCAPEGHCPPRGITPVNGVRGKRSYGHEVSIWPRPRWRFGYFAAMGKVTRRPQAAKLPAKWRAGSSRPTPGKRLFLHRPLIRPLRGHLPLSLLSLRDISP